MRMLSTSSFLRPLVCGTYISAGWRRPARDVGSNWPSCGCIGVPRGTPWTTLHIHGEPLPRWPRRGRVHARCFLGELLVACFCCHWRSISVSAGGNENVINGALCFVSKPVYRVSFSRIGRHFRVVRKLIPLDLATAPNVSNMRAPPPGYCLCRKAAAYCNSTGTIYRRQSSWVLSQLADAVFLSNRCGNVVRPHDIVILY